MKTEHQTLGNEVLRVWAQLQEAFQNDESNLAPLKKFLEGETQFTPEDFTYQGSLDEEDFIYRYRHNESLNWLLLDEEANAYRYVFDQDDIDDEGFHMIVSRLEALREVFRRPGGGESTLRIAN